MRNLKRALSLALASVMVMSMTLIGASAVSIDDFSDSSEIVNKEAVTVLATLGVITGNDDGSYTPANTITRAEMSTIICRVLNGGKDPVLGEAVTNTYTDTTSHWAKNYIEYCTTLGIVAGKGDGTFDPNGEVTVAEAAKMVLVALGYNAPMEGYTGANWQINVDARANPLGLYDDLSYTTTSSPLTRDNAAQMLYNALDCKMVKYSVVLDTTSSTVISTTQLDETNETLLENKFNSVKVEGVVVANEMANLNASADGNGSSLEVGKTRIVIDEEADQDHYTGEKVFNVSSDLNDLGRYVAIYVKKENNSTNAQVLGSVIVSENNKVVTDASGDDIETVASDNDLDLTSATLVAKNYQGLTALGSLDDATATAGVEKILIDYDDDSNVDYVLLNTYYFGRVTTYVASGDGSIAIDVGATESTSYYTKDTTRLTADDQDDVVGFEDVAKDDYVLAQYIGGDLHVELAESVTGVVDSYKFNDTGSLITKVTMDGTEYNVSNVTGYKGGDDDIRKAADEADEYVTNEATAFLDKNGYVVAIGDAEANAGRYALVLAVGQNIEDRVKVALADGTIATYDLNDSGSSALKKSELNVGQVYNYTINSNNAIKLTTVNIESQEMAGAKFEKGKITIDSDDPDAPFYASSNTAFFYVTDNIEVNGVTTIDGKIITGDHDQSINNDDVNIYASYRTAPDLKADAGITATIYTRGLDNRVVAVVFAGDELASADVSDHLYIASIVSSNGSETTIRAYVNGSAELQDVVVDEDIGRNDAERRRTYTYSINPDGTYSLDDYMPYTVDLTVDRVVGDNVVTTDGTVFTISDDTVIVDDSAYLDSITATMGDSGTISEDDKIIGLVCDGTDALMVVIRNPKVSGGTVDGPVVDWDGVTNPGATPLGINNLSDDGNLSDIVAEFRAGNDVYIDDDLLIDDTLNIPKGRTVYVTGSVTIDAAGDITGNGTLMVGTDLVTTTKSPTTSTIGVKDNWNVNDSLTLADGNKLTIEGDVIIADTKTLTVAGTVKASNVRANNTSANLTVGSTGHVETTANGSLGTGTIIVDGANSLIVGGTITAGTLTIGSSSEGRVTAANVNVTTVEVEKGSLTVEGAINATNVTVTDSALAAASVTVSGTLKIEQTGTNEVSVTVPVVSGIVEQVIADDTKADVSVATDASSEVTPKGTISVDTVLNGEVTFTEETTIAADVTLTINGTVTGLDNLKGASNTAVVVFGRNAVIEGAITKYVYSDGSTPAVAKYMPGLGFTWDGSKFVNDVEGMIYTLRDTNSATAGSQSVYGA